MIHVIKGEKKKKCQSRFFCQEHHNDKHGSKMQGANTTGMQTFCNQPKKSVTLT